MLCPKCKTDRAHLSRRTGLWEHLASIGGTHPYRCRECAHRFASRRVPLAEPVSPAAQEISSTRRILRWRRKRRHLMLYGGALLMFAVILYYLSRTPVIGD
jgi:hypothetical protein